MKALHVTLISLFTSTLLLAGTVPNERILQEAKQSFDAKEFKKAYGFFENLSTEMATNAEVQFYLGLSAMELQKYDEALAAFDRVLMLDPNHTRTKLEIARVYYISEQYEQASVEVRSILTENLPFEVKKSVDAFKATLEEKLKKEAWLATVSIGAMYDNNANNTGLDQFNYLTLPVTSGKAKSDTYLYATAGITHIYDIGERGEWFVESNGLFYLKMNRHITDNNLGLFSLSTKPYYNEGSYRIGFPISFDRAYLSGEGYAKVLQGGVEASYLIDDRSMVLGGLMLKRSYYDDDNTLDANANVWSLAYKRSFGEDPIILSLGASYENSQNVRSSGLNVSADTWTYKIEASKMLVPDLLGSLSYSYEHKDYDILDIGFSNPHRKDKESTYGVGLSYMLDKTSSINAIISYANQNSTQEPYKYDKTAIGINYIKSF